MQLTRKLLHTDSEWLFHTRSHCCDVWQRFSFCSIFTSWLIHVLYSFNLLSTVKPFFFWWKFGLCTAYPCKRITDHKAKWPSVATDAQLRYRVVLLDVYWNKRKTERDGKDRAVRLIPHNSASLFFISRQLFVVNRWFPRIIAYQIVWAWHIIKVSVEEICWCFRSIS